MAEVLSDEEIDQLLTAIAPGDGFDLSPAGTEFKDIKDFEAFLTKRKFMPEEIYRPHSFEKEITMCRFFQSKDGEKILADIERKNREQNMGNIAIPNTKIKLINYSICPKCKTVFSFKDLTDYYGNPKTDSIFKSRAYQMRLDTRVCCYECGEYYLPALVITDGTPKNEIQFLCRMQTVEAIEKFFLEKDEKILSRNPANITRENGYITIRNDLPLAELEPKPTLISNILQYTPINLMPSLIDGTSITKGDILFGKLKEIN